MKLIRWMTMIAFLGCAVAWAEVPELTALVPEAKDYELIAKLNPLEWSSVDYSVDRTAALSGDLKRVGYLLKLTNKNGSESWVFTSMDAFTQELDKVCIPASDSDPIQTYVDNLEVYSGVEGVKTGKFEKGNIEFWYYMYGGGNSKKIPGATNNFDFGDNPGKNGDYGSFQVHNYLEKQTIFAFNNFFAGNNCDLGIGNCPGSNPDWTFTKAGKNYKSAELFIVGTFENLKVNQQVKEIVPLNTAKAFLDGASDKDPLSYAPGETMTFTITPDFSGQTPTEPYFFKWTRTGDDGKTDSGNVEITGEPIVIKTSLDCPGFVRIYGMLTNKKGKKLTRMNAQKRHDIISFDGGAGVETEKLVGTPEPNDFDAFWDKQKAKLAEIPIKYTMDKKSADGDKVEVYAVSVDCAGPRPVTGYLTIPANATEKSLPAVVTFNGYGMGPDPGPKAERLLDDQIKFHINAHGFELGKTKEYYDQFAESIKSNGKNYAFDPVQNSDPETAYFNGMALRVMRALQFVKQLPQWNGKELTVSGASQGGLQTIWAAGLDPDVSKAMPGVPWCCDIGGQQNFNRNRAGFRMAYTESLNYYDPINFAKRIKCPVEVTRAGLGDYTCPPSGVAVFYNNLTCPKKINWYQGSEHGYVPRKPQIFVREQK